MSKKIEITLTPQEAENFLAHLTLRDYHPTLAAKVGEQIVEQLSYSEAKPLDWANDVRNLAYLRSIGGL